MGLGLKAKLRTLSLVIMTCISSLSLLALTQPTVSAAETTDSVSIGFEYNYWELDESVTIPLVPFFEDMAVGVDSAFILAMPSTISMTTDSELVSPTTQSVTVTLATQDANFRLDFIGYLNLSGVVSEEYSFIDVGFNEEFSPLVPVHIEGVNVPLLRQPIVQPIVEMGVSIDLDIDAYVTADLYRGNDLLEHLRWEDSGGTKSFSYTIPEISSTTTDTLSVKNITWNYDLILDLDFYATIDIVVWSGSKDLFTIPLSLPSATNNITGTANVSYSIRPPIPPEVSIKTPASNATVGGTVTISADATDDKGVNRVEFWVDGVNKFTDYSSPYDWSWDTTSYPDDTHTVGVMAYDDDEKSAYQEYSVNVKNAYPEPPGEEEEEEEQPSSGQGIGNLLIILVVMGIIVAAIAATAIYLRRR